MKLSVVTVCRNSQHTIARAIESVLCQRNADVEYIVVDGKSTDRTLSVIDNYRDAIDVVISERDDGIYSAMNKGLDYCSGDVVHFLNSDDYLHDETVVSDVSRVFTMDGEAGLVYGNVVMFDESRQWLVRYADVDERFFYKHTICHQAVFAKRELFEQIGKFDEQYKIHADVDWLMKVFFGMGNVFRYYDRSICFFSATGFCSNPVNANRYKLDRQEISAKYFLEARLKLIAKKVLKNLRLRLRTRLLN